LNSQSDCASVDYRLIAANKNSKGEAVEVVFYSTCANLPENYDVAGYFCYL